MVSELSEEIMLLNEKVKIRLATDKDFEQILSIYLDGISTSFDLTDYDIDKIRQKFSSNFFDRSGIFNFWIAETEQGEMLGWQSLIRASNNPFRENKYAESSTYISKFNRYKGVGKALLAYALNEAQKSDLAYIIGFIEINNKASIKITNETGWIRLGEIPDSGKEKGKFRQLFLVRPV